MCILYTTIPFILDMLCCRLRIIVSIVQRVIVDDLFLLREGDIIGNIEESLSVDDQSFIQAIYEQYKRLMFSTAIKFVADSPCVDDIVQNVIISLISKIPILRRLNAAALCAYIVKAVKNTSRDYLKKQTSEWKNCLDVDIYSNSDIDPVPSMLLTPSPEDIIIKKENTIGFSNAFKRLSDKDKRVLSGRYILGLSDEELAAQYGCEPASIRMVLTRVRRNALQLMREDDLSYDGK